MSDDSFKTLIGFLKNKNYTGVRKWVSENSDIESTELFRKFYDLASEVMVLNSIPQLVIYLADYQYKAAFVADHEINTLAFLTEVLAECEFK